MDKYYLRAIRIAAKSKLPDRWIHSQWYQPLDSEEAGTTFVLIEVVNPWFPSPQITTTITNTFNREYFRQRRVGKASDAFEVAVRRVNEALAARAEEGETDWIGNLHAILAVISGAELHLVEAGKPAALLIRGGEVSAIGTPRELAEAPGPINTFGNLVSGTLVPGDKGVFATPDLLEYAPAATLADALADPVDQAAKRLVKDLQEQRVKTPHAVLFDFQTTPHPEREGESDTVFLDVPLEGSLHRLRHATRHVVGPALAKGAGATFSAARWFWGKTKENVLPAVSTGVGKIGSMAKRGGETISQTTQAVEEKVTRVDSETVVNKPLGFLARIMNGLAALARSLRLRSRLLFVGLGLIVLAVVVLRYMTVQRQNTSRIAREAAQELLVSAQQKKEEGDLAALSKENDRAISLYIEALDLSRQAKENRDLITAAEEVEAAAQASLDGLTQTTRITESEPYARFETAAKFYVVDRSPWVIGSDGIVSAAPAGGERTQGGKLEGLGTIAGTGYVADHQKLYVVGLEGIGSVNIADGTVEKLATPEGGWEKAVAVESYGTTLYFLDAAGSQIWKYATTAEGLSLDPPTGYFTEKPDLKETIDLAIDGSIYVLSADGTVKSYFKGAEEAFTVSELPKPYETWEKPLFIATDASAAGVYIFESSDKRIVEVDKNGAYKRQFALPGSWDVKDIFVAGAAKKLYVLAGNDVYEISL